MRKKRKRRIKLGRIFFLLIVLLVLGAGGYGYFNLQPVGDSTEEREFEIEEGQTLTQVFTNMEAEGRIKNASVAKIYAKFTNHQKYYAGKFMLRDDMSVLDILNTISDAGKTVNTQVKITIPEGYWAKQIAAILSDTISYSEEEILEQWNDMDYIKELSKDYEFIDPKALANDELIVKLEGYLFPQTYFIEEDASIDDVTRILLDQFDVVYKKYEEEFKDSDLSVEELITLASIVQFETGNEEDMSMIAQVFYNRLKAGMKLQSSATVCYALYDEFDDPKACETRIDVDSPYNTYLVEGLPTGPILNPGEAAILAVLEPQPNDYLFFAADIHNVKGTLGKVYYTKTFDEHQKLIEELNLIIE